MAKKLLQNEAAEQEANDVAERFMNSDDVLRDMRVEYGSRLDGVQLHDDEEAQKKVKAVRRDAVARGRDVYFGRGILQSKAPEAKGLIAHELAHTMQQDGYGGMSERISFGEEQGGLLDKIQGFFGRKKLAARQTPVKKNYLDEESYQKALELEAGGEKKARDAGIMASATQMMTEGMSSRMQGKDAHDARLVWRDNNGEVQTFMRNAERMLPKDFMKNAMDFKLPYSLQEREAAQKQGVRREFVQENMAGPVLQALTNMRDIFENDSGLVDYLAGGGKAFEGSSLTDENGQAELLLNSFMLNAIAPRFFNTGSAILKDNKHVDSKDSVKYLDFSARLQRAFGDAEDNEDILAVKGQLQEILKRHGQGSASPAPAASASAAAPYDHEAYLKSAGLPSNPSREELRRILKNSGYASPAVW
ncbi:MAG: DUF4157 domain-containing protein [Lachnospiraceae bacterium]|nr:DUF4157 domain-containing protein [Lachnospiraceae bacterium]